MRIYIYNIIFCSLFMFFLTSEVQADTIPEIDLLRGMEDELNRNMQELKEGDTGTPFFIAYTLNSNYRTEIQASHGAILSSYRSPREHVASVQLYLGDYKVNSDNKYTGEFPKARLPLELSYDVVRESFWKLSDQAYREAKKKYKTKKNYLENRPRAGDRKELLDFTPLKHVVNSIIPGTPAKMDKEILENYARQLSGIFVKYKEIFNSQVSIEGKEFVFLRKSSEEITQRHPQSNLNIQVKASVRGDQGDIISDNYRIYVSAIEDLPSLEKLSEDIENFAGGLIQMKSLEPMNEAFEGSVLFEGEAAYALFFRSLIYHESLLSTRVPDGVVQPRNLAEKINKQVIDNRITVKNYTTINEYNGEKVYGAYAMDAEGVVPPEELVLIDKGVIKTLLNGRFPIPCMKLSTGSSRFCSLSEDAKYLIAPGVLHVQVEKGSSDEKLRKILLKNARQNKQTYAYIIKKLYGATIVERIDVKTGESKRMRANLSTRLATIDILDRIVALGKEEIINSYFWSSQVLFSMIHPESVIVSGIELRPASISATKDFPLAHPLKR